MLIRLIISPADENRSGANQMRQHLSFREHFRRGNAHAPQFVVDDLLRAEGFTDVQYVYGASSAEINEAVASGKVDFNTHFAPQWVSLADAGGAVTVLSGVHVGCFELFGKEGIRSIADLKGKTVGVAALGSSDHLFVSVMAAHIGLDPASDIHWVTSQSPTAAELFSDGKIDACLGLPPCRKIFAHGTSATLWSTAQLIARGHNISAACWQATESSCGNIRLRPNASFARC
jgi:ABC-type nitrate/sulfonate/bicarbonate transport system substrate-binding protein